MKTTIVQADHRRLEKALAFSALLWALIFVGFSRIVLKGPEVPRDSMNPLYVELAPPPPKAQEKPSEPPTTQIGGAAVASQGLGTPSALTSRPSAASQSSTAAEGTRPSASVRAGGSAAVYTLHADPGSAPLPNQAAPAEGSAPRISSGTDQWAPLSEQSLAAEAPAAPAAPPGALESRGGQSTAKTTRAAGSAGASADTFSQTWSQTAQKLSSAPASSAPSSSTPSTGTGSVGSKAGASSSGGGTEGASGAGGLQGVGGDLGGSIDFGSGSPRELWSPRRIRVPDALMRGKPNSIVTRVSFTVERGGTVLAPTIRFDPPLPSDLDAYLRTAFSSWLFSPADSDGQARFSYSIKVR